MKKRECPICKMEYTGYPALSRKDNKTEICPDCGTKEALQACVDYMKILKGKSDKHVAAHTCIFENRYCEYAENTGKSFNCNAPSDEEMTCNK